MEVVIDSSLHVGREDKAEGYGQRKVRITTWNVNGIRNPFGYQPWREKRTFAAMFDILEADIVIMQETKIQRKDLRDDMVLVPGWDVYFNLPKHKKGYSGVAIYTRSSVCAPIRAEEGITGILTPPNSSLSFCDLPKDQQIGGYPQPGQLEECALDFATLDSEGRCVILEFPAFVLIGVYCPANRDETRDEFRIGFLDALDVRIRNLVALGKRVFLAGDLNIIRDCIDTANAREQLNKQGISVEQYVSTPARRMLNHLLVDGRVIGARDEGREESILEDICRAKHPERQGMFTCWEQKVNARPGNFGSRIDYVLCSKGWGDWFCDANIQEGLVGSDHCPVYAILKGAVTNGGEEVDVRDVMSSGMFSKGVRQREWSAKDLLPMSAKLIPEFDRRRSIRDMFTKKPSMPISVSSFTGSVEQAKQSGCSNAVVSETVKSQSRTPSPTKSGVAGEVSSPTILPSPKKGEKRSSDAMVPSAQVSNLTKRLKSNVKVSASASKPSEKTMSNVVVSQSMSVAKKGQAGKGQSCLTGFFKPKTPELNNAGAEEEAFGDSKMPSNCPTSIAPSISQDSSDNLATNTDGLKLTTSPSPNPVGDPGTRATVVDPIKSKESWSKLLRKRVVPRCEHDEPCISQLTKKAGINCGRSFYMCPRPLGPSGKKEKDTQWRCGTFIWSSDWTRDAT